MIARNNASAQINTGYTNRYCRDTSGLKEFIEISVKRLLDNTLQDTKITFEERSRSKSGFY